MSTRREARGPRWRRPEEHPLKGPPRKRSRAKPALPPLAPTSLDQLAGELRELHQLIAQHQSRVLDRAHRAGEVLLKVKEVVGHGNFMPWVEAHCSFKHGTALLYMRIARDWNRLPKSQRVANLGIAEAYRFLRRRSRPRHIDKEHPSPETVGKEDGEHAGSGRIVDAHLKDIKRFQEGLARAHEQRERLRSNAKVFKVRYKEVREQLDQLEASW